MSKAYVCWSRRRANGSWTKWQLLGLNPNLEHARKELVDVFGMLLMREDRGREAECDWEKMIEAAKTAEIGDVLECDERQWRITFE